MISSAQKVRLGVFLVVSASLLIGTIAVLAGLRAIERRDEYTVTVIGSVSGLEEGAQVEYQGVRVGRVDDIRINPDDVGEVKVLLSLESGTPIKSDTRAVVNMAGITGLKNIELVGGTRESPLLPPGSDIPPGESTLDRLTGKAEVIAGKVELLLNRLIKALDDDTLAHVASIIAQADGVMTGVRDIVDENRADLRTFSRGLAETGGGLAATMSRLESELTETLQAVRDAATALGGLIDREAVDRILARVDSLVAQLGKSAAALDVRGLSKDARSMLQQAEKLLASVDLTVTKSRQDIFVSLNYLVQGLEDFSDFTALVRENPSLLLKAPPESRRDR